MPRRRHTYTLMTPVHGASVPTHIKKARQMATLKNMTIAAELSGNGCITIHKSWFGLSQTAFYEPTGSKLTAVKKEFDLLTGRDIELALSAQPGERAQRIAKLGKVADTPIGNCLLEGCYSADRQFAAARMLKFVDLRYTPVTDTAVFEGDSAAAVIDALLA